MRQTTRLTTALVLSVSAAALAAGGAAAQEESWPPSLQPMPDSFDARSPEETLESFTLPPGYEIDLVASEPLIGDAIVMQWGFDGDLWVVETTYMVSEEELTTPTPQSDILVLSDTDGDGVMDERTAFAEGLVLPRSLLVLEPGKVLVAEPPNILLMEDTDGDGVSDTSEVLVDTYGVRGGSIEHDANGLVWNIDNRIYSAYHDVVYDWTGEGLEPVPGIDISQWGVGYDDEGRLYRQGNSEPPRMTYVSDTYYGRNSVFDRERGSNEWIGGDSAETLYVYPARPTPGVNRGYVAGTLREDGTLQTHTSAGGLGVYRGSALAEEDSGNVLVPEPAGNLVAMLNLSDDGSGILQEKPYDEADFLTSTDERFRPIFVGNGPDGAAYILDLYHGIIQDAEFMTKYLYDYASERGLFDTQGFNGRIYRVTHEDGDRQEIMDLGQSSPEELVELLSNENGWYRDHAQRLLVVQQHEDAVPALTELLSSGEDEIARLHALWTLHGLDALEEDHVVEAMEAEGQPMLTAAAIRAGEQWLDDPESPVTAAFDALMGSDVDWRVKYQLAASAGEVSDDRRLDTILAAIEAYGGDYIALDAALSGVPDEDVYDLFERLMEVESESDGVRQAIATVATALTTYGTSDEVSSMLEAIGTDGRPAWQVDAAVLGMEIVLAGVADPGEAEIPEGPEMGAWNDPPASDRAFPEYREQLAEVIESADAERPEDNSVRETALTEVEGLPTLALASEPDTFLALQDDPDLADRVEMVSLLMTWPGQ